MFTQLMMALEAAHANGIIHRNVHVDYDSTIFVTPEGDLKLGGFERAYIGNQAQIEKGHVTCTKVG